MEKDRRMSKEQEPSWEPMPEDEWLLNIMLQIEKLDSQREAYMNLIQRYQNSKAIGLRVHTGISDGAFGIQVAPKGEMGFNK